MEKKITSLSLSSGREEKPRGVMVYTVKCATPLKALRDAPEEGTRTHYFPDECILQRREAATTATEGEIRVTLTYYPAEPETIEDRDKKEPVYNLKTFSKSVSILLNDRYEKINKDLAFVGKMLIDGEDPMKKVYYAINIRGEKRKKILVVNELNADATATAKKYGLTWTETTLKALSSLEDIRDEDALGAELLDYILSGVKNFDTASAEWKETVYKKSISNALNGLCKIDSPPGPNPHLEGNWLYSGAIATKTASDKLWKIEKTWTLSDAGTKWNKDLYSAKPSGL